MLQKTIKNAAGLAPTVGTIIEVITLTVEIFRV
jgi:hypothetical protein